MKKETKRQVTELINSHFQTARREKERLHEYIKFIEDCLKTEKKKEKELSKTLEEMRKKSSKSEILQSIQSEMEGKVLSMLSQNNKEKLRLKKQLITTKNERLNRTWELKKYNDLLNAINPYEKSA